MSRPDDVLDLFSRTSDGVMAVDQSCRVILWNRAAEAILGYSASEVLGRACHEMMHGRDESGNLFCHPHCSVLTMARRDELAHAYDIVARGKDGTERWLNVSTILVPGRAGNIVVHLFRDVAGARKAQDLLRTAADPLRPFLSAAGPSTGPERHLTSREREVLRLMACGEGTRAIARRLFISTATVRNHTQSILAKLGVHSRLEAVAHAFRSRAI